MQREDKQVLGRETRRPIEAEQLDTVPWNHTDTDAAIEFSTSELTALCPITGQPDFYELELSYRPGPRLLESKSMKLYLWGFRDKGMFAEDMAATLLKDLVAACDPVEMTVDLVQQVRGGLKIRTVVRHSPEG
jgi:7-cyano-7-deazaguanine reductase